MLGNRFEEALLFACHVHAADKRKGTQIPYVSHLLTVAGIVIEYGGTEEEAVAALLHDSVEDHGGEAMLEHIRLRFGDAVARIVDGCSDSKTADPSRKASWEERKKAYIGRIPNEPRSVRLVSAADKLANARSILRDYRRIGDNLWKRFNAKKKQILWYYDELVQAFQDSETRQDLVDELARVVTDIKLEIERRTRRLAEPSALS